MLIQVYLPGGADTLLIPEGADALDCIFEAFGVYAEYDVIG